MKFDQPLILLLKAHQLPPEFDDHELTRQLAGYHEFHLRDTPSGNQPNDINDVLVVYIIDEDELILIGIRVGSHNRLFPDQTAQRSTEKKMISRATFIQITLKQPL